MNKMNPVLLRLLMDQCEHSRTQIIARGIAVADKFTCAAENAEQESESLLSALKDAGAARQFGIDVRTQFGKRSCCSMLCGHPVVLIYDPELDLALDFDEAFAEGWNYANVKIEKETHEANVDKFIGNMKQLNVAPGMPVVVKMPAGDFSAIVVYVHPLWHAVAVELLDNQPRPCVVMLGSHHDMYPVEIRTI